MNKLKQICQEIKDHNGQAFIVGGYPRDLLLQKQNKDIDIEVFNLEIDILKSILEKYGKLKEVGKSFGVLKLEHYDFSIPRNERKSGNGHKGFIVELNPYMTIQEACKRRDLTINAILFDPLTENFIDPYNGIKDLKNKLIRHVSEKFAEDPLRVLRVAQFSSRFDFEIFDKTSELCKDLVEELEHLPKERLFTEIEKIMLKSQKPSIAFKFLEEIGIISHIFPELNKLDPKVLNYIFNMLDNVDFELRKIDIMLTILCLKFNERNTRSFLSRITNDISLTESIVNLVNNYSNFCKLKENVSRVGIKKLAIKTNISKLAQINIADFAYQYHNNIINSKEILTIYEEEIFKDSLKPIISGRHLIELGLEPSPKFKIILEKAFEAQLEEKFDNLEEGLEYLKMNVL